jgi:hypothetical protein
LCTDTCKAYCSNGAAKAVKDTVKCTVGMPTLGIAGAVEMSDQGHAIKHGHASVRTAGRPPIPEDAYQEMFDTLINNDVSEPRVARSAVSCRKPHRESTFGHYVPALDAQGNPKLRTGFMVGCRTSSDCTSRCKKHPITGMDFVCTKNAQFYSRYVINRSMTEHDFAINTEQIAPVASAGLLIGQVAQAAKLEYKARRRWIPLPGSTERKVYLANEPGDDSFDVETSEQMGVCTDIRYDFQHTQCESVAASAVILGLVGCTAKLGWVRAYCGARLERTGPDFLDDVSISSESLSWPRTLVAANTIGGAAQREVECSDETDCMNKCDRFRRIARNGGLPEPAGCALCDAVCPSNLGTTVTDVVAALTQDIANAVRLASRCVGDSGFGGCICNIFMMLKPAWIDTLPSPRERCEGGNIFGLLASKILELALTAVESAINGFVIDKVNAAMRAVVGWIPFVNGDAAPQIPQACLTAFWNPRPSQCSRGEGEMAALGCYGNEGEAAHKMCYVARQKAICAGADGAYARYKSLFTAPSGDALEAQYRAVAGGSFNAIDPAFQSVFNSIQNSVQSDDVTAAQDICDSSVRSPPLPSPHVGLFTLTAS